MQLTRRQMLATAAFLTAVPALGRGSEKDRGYTYHLARVSGPSPTLPEGKYIPFDWTFSEILANGDTVRLTWEQKVPQHNQPIRLRITSATDVRELCKLEVKTGSGQRLGELDIRFAHYMQPFELEIPAASLDAVLSEGVELSMSEGTRPFWFFSAPSDLSAIPTAFRPHLLVAGNGSGKEAVMDRLISLDSVQTFGWMQGVVWDGLFEVGQKSREARQVLARQLDLYLGNDKLMYANLNNVKTENKISTVESILPFAILAQTSPGHPLLQTAIDFCKNHANSQGVVADGSGDNRMLKTEECYTVSYPLAVLAKTLQRPGLTELAINSLQARVDLLDRGSSIYQRGQERGELYFANWGRGIVWYLLGLAKTLPHLPKSDQKTALVKSFREAAAQAIAYQQPGGLWHCFLSEPATGLETSGTAGLAAALNYGFQKALLPDKARQASLRAQAGLTAYLTPDGYLTGSAQVNKGGDSLQRNGFRIISPYTLGFLAHLDFKKR